MTNKYIGLKQITAWTHPKDGQPGYGVMYADGYESWSPKDVFEEAYREIQDATYSIALESIMRGGRWTRTGWNGADQYIEAQFPDEHSKMTQPYIYIRTVQGDKIPWLCSQGDAFAQDWMEI